MVVGCTKFSGEVEQELCKGVEFLSVNVVLISIGSRCYPALVVDEFIVRTKPGKWLSAVVIDDNSWTAGQYGTVYLAVRVSDIGVGSLILIVTPAVGVVERSCVLYVLEPSGVEPDFTIVGDTDSLVPSVAVLEV